MIPLTTLYDEYIDPFTMNISIYIQNSLNKKPIWVYIPPSPLKRGSEQKSVLNFLFTKAYDERASISI